MKLTEKERRDLEYKEQVYKLAVERKKQLGKLPTPCAVAASVRCVDFCVVMWL